MAQVHCSDDMHGRRAWLGILLGIRRRGRTYTQHALPTAPSITWFDGRGSSLRSASYNQLLGAWTSICVSPQAGLGLPSCPRTTSSSNSRQGVHPMVKHRVVGCPPRDGASPGAWGGGVPNRWWSSEPELVRRTGASPARHAMRSLSLSLSTRRATLFDGMPAARPCRRSGLRVRASAERAAPLTPFPLSYRQVVLQCQQSVQAALTDGMKLVEVRPPERH